MPKKSFFSKSKENGDKSLNAPQIDSNLIKKSSNAQQNALTFPSTSIVTPASTIAPKSEKILTPKPNYQTYLRLKRECLRRKQLYVDVSFPPTNSSLFLDVNRSSNIVWKRPRVHF